ncbi:MAG: lipocalin family protein [Pseudoalteromonas sp.]|uniref:lipocalin family protein n=1 Tax=unclassified Pseudoalteromonas TaxID=194690 RepID=UPI003F984170
MKFKLFVLLGVLSFAGLAGCTGVPESITPVKSFSVDRFQGQWYEIARLDHSFEEGLEQVTANYSINDDGSVKVVNKGYNTKEQQWSEAQGKAKFVDSKDVGHLKVSFFGPFYSSYVVFKLDQENYNYAYVTGYDKDYLWLLSRTPTISEERKADFIKTAKAKGFNTDELIFVKQSPM